MRKASLKHFQIEFQLVENKIRSIEKHIQSIQHQSGTNQARQIVIKSFIAFSINQATGSIDRKFGKLRFLKNIVFYAETPQSTLFYE